MIKLIIDEETKTQMRHDRVNVLRSGYVRAAFNKKAPDGGHWWCVHHFVWELFNGPRKQGHHIHHKDGNRENNCIDNLEELPAAVHMREANLGKPKPGAGGPGIPKTEQHRANISKSLRARGDKN